MKALVLFSGGVDSTTCLGLAVDKYGADILRLWVASSDYHADIRISPEILKQLSDAYRKRLLQLV